MVPPIDTRLRPPAGGDVTRLSTDEASAAEDRRLVVRMAEGDDSALGALYDRWVTTVHALAFRILADRDEAEEAVEDTFWQLWRQAASYETTRGSVATWIMTVARSRALDRRRGIARRRTESFADSAPTADAAASSSVRLDTVAATSDDPAESAIASERRALVSAALSELPAEQREAMDLTYFGGLSQSEIAERTGLPLGTVKTRVRLAVQKLRERLAPLLAEGALS
jgi:RNA polymerase sigma-70 factor (ECF subfamily)